MAGWVADKSLLLIMVLQIDSENSATGMTDKDAFSVVFLIISTFVLDFLSKRFKRLYL